VVWKTNPAALSSSTHVVTVDEFHYVTSSLSHYPQFFFQGALVCKPFYNDIPEGRYGSAASIPFNTPSTLFPEFFSSFPAAAVFSLSWFKIYFFL
jgi:hypothetical protein